MLLREKEISEGSEFSKNAEKKKEKRDKGRKTYSERCHSVIHGKGGKWSATLCAIFIFLVRRHRGSEGRGSQLTPCCSGSKDNYENQEIKAKGKKA